MSIQEFIDFKLKKVLTDKTKMYTEQTIGDIKFLKAELQRGKNKIVNDADAIVILVGLLKNQRELQKKLNIGSKEYTNCSNFIQTIGMFVPDDVLKQLYIEVDQVCDWLKTNIDFSKLKNPMQAIKIVQMEFPYIDGNIIKKAITMLEESR